jgi:hypothetical protein
MRRAVFFFMAFLFFGSFSFGQKARYHSQVLFRMLNHVDWPDYRADYKFIVGVVGNQGDYQYFQGVVPDYRLDDRVIEVRYFNCTDRIDECDLVYLSESCDIDINKVIEKTKNCPIMVVSSGKGYGQSGSVVNFVETADGKIHIELNEQQARERGLLFSAQLKMMLILI